MHSRSRLPFTSGVSWPTRTATKQGKNAAAALYVLVMVAVVVVVDVLFIGHYFWRRLIVNIGIVLVFAAFDARFLQRT